MIVSGAVRPIIVLANSGSFETKTQCMSILQRMLGRAMPEEVSCTCVYAAELLYSGVARCSLEPLQPIHIDLTLPPRLRAVAVLICPMVDAYFMVLFVTRFPASNRSLKCCLLFTAHCQTTTSSWLAPIAHSTQFVIPPFFWAICGH